VSWLHNSGCPPRSTVELRGRDLGLQRDGFCLAHALLRGLPWKDGVMPKPVRGLTQSRRAVEPWMIIALLRACADPDLAREVVTGAPREATEENAAGALEEAARRRGLRGARLVGSYLTEPPRRIIPSAAPLSEDVELTLLVLAKCTRRVFIAGKRPALDLICPGTVIELVGPALSEEKR